MPQKSRAEVAKEIRETLAGLAKLAAAADLAFLGYLIAMAEAEAQIEQCNASFPERKS